MKKPRLYPVDTTALIRQEAWSDSRTADRKQMSYEDRVVLLAWLAIVVGMLAIGALDPVVIYTIVD